MSVTKYLKRGIRYILNSIPTENITANISYLSPDERLKGKKIIVTGGGRGIGYAMSRKFIEEGAEVLIAGRNEGILRESSEQLKCKYLQLDVQNIDSFASFIHDNRHPRAHCLLFVCFSDHSITSSRSSCSVSLDIIPLPPVTSLPSLLRI